jgi:hypothetical protein
MLRILGSPAKLCDSITRREMMRVGGLSLFAGTAGMAGMTLPSLLAASVGDPARRSRAKAKSVILFNLLGGPSHIDMFDMKPDAPSEIRGEFRPIRSSVPGLEICEHLPRTARLMHKTTLIRSFSHTFNSHDPLPIMTGFTDDKPLAQAMPSDPPDIGAICQYLGLGPKDLPAAVCMPNFPGEGQNHRRRGPYGGFLGQEYDPLFTRCAPTFDREPSPVNYDPVMPRGEPQLPSLDDVPSVSADRLEQRRSLLGQLDDGLRVLESSKTFRSLNSFQQQAFELLLSGRAREAFDLSREPAALRERYGRNLFGASLLTARRLVEAGVPFVSVHQEIFKHYGHAYDMHQNNFSMLRDFNLPLLDTVFPALIEDLEARGLLESTLVIVMGEMGRTPRINRHAGRDHWPQCGFSLLAGGGVKQGYVHGATDEHAALPTSGKVSPADLVATIYHLLGIDPDMTVQDLFGRPVPIAHGGNVVHDILA